MTVSGNLAVSAVQTAHAALAARGQWATNDKTLLDRAGLRGIDSVIAELGDSPESLAASIARAEELFDAAT